MHDSTQAILDARQALAAVYDETADDAMALGADVGMMPDPDDEDEFEKIVAFHSKVIAARREVNAALLAARDRFHGWLTQRVAGLDTEPEQLQFRRELGSLWIPEWREAEGMTLREAGEVLDLVASTLSRWESMPDERWPSWETAVAVVPRMHLGDPSLLPLTVGRNKPWLPWPFPARAGKRRPDDVHDIGGVVVSVSGFRPLDSEKASERRWNAARESLLESVDDKSLRAGQLEVLARLARWPEALDALRFPPQDPLRQALEPVLGAGPFQRPEPGDDE